MRDRWELVLLIALEIREVVDVRNIVVRTIERSREEGCSGDRDGIREKVVVVVVRDEMNDWDRSRDGREVGRRHESN